MLLDFKILKEAIGKQFATISQNNLYVADVTKEQLWNTYINSFPKGSNPIYKERTEHDCNICKSFIRTIGHVIAIKDNNPITIWDFPETGTAYDVVAKAMNDLIKNAPIRNIFLVDKNKIGVDKTNVMEEQKIILWNHFFVNIPNMFVCNNDFIGTKLAEFSSTYQVYKRGLTELTDEAIDIVIDLINQNSLYRGEEHKNNIIRFKELKKQYSKINNSKKDFYIWSTLHTENQTITRIRNTAIGTLLTDISEGVDLELAVISYEKKVAPENYKRPTALVTKDMINKAKKTINDLGLSSALNRKFATIDDIPVSEMLFVNRMRKSAIVTDNVFESINATKEKIQDYSKLQEITIDKFITDILPTTKNISILVENKHKNNFVSLLTAEDPTAGQLFKWDNPLSWSYTGEFTDSIKEKVKAAGGSIDGELRCSLSWFNNDDLDLHMYEPNRHIFYGDEKSPSGGILDIDMNAGSNLSKTPVENIIYKKLPKQGKYILKVDQYNKRESKDVGFDIQIECMGTTYTFSYTQPVVGTITVAEFNVTSNGIEMLTEMKENIKSKKIWNIDTHSFINVKAIMKSPNYWSNNNIGNCHYFFMLENCINEDTARGFYNEFLRSDLDKHRKVFEIVGSKVKAAENDKQLSGIGFSTTKQNSVICKVEGSFNRLIKILI